MQSTQDQILERLRLLPEGMLREVLRFVEVLVERLGGSKTISTPVQDGSGKRSLGEAIQLLRSQIDSEEMLLEDEDIFADVRDQTPAPLDARW